MATIYPRTNKDGSTSYRLQIRRKGLKHFSATFSSLEEAKEFMKKNEPKYCLDQDAFTFDRLERNRKNEFARKI